MMSEGVTITFEMKLKPEAVDGFLQAAPQMMQETKGFGGCQAIKVVQHKDDPTRLLFVEQWESEDRYRAYMNWRSERGDMEAFAPLLVSTQTDVWPNLICQA